MNLKIFAGLSLLFLLVTMMLAEIPIEVPGVIYNARGAGLAMTNFDENPRPDMVLMVYDTSQQPNQFRYKIGWNLDANGISNHWSDDILIPGVGWLTHGAGVAVAQLDNDPRPEMILMIYYYYEENPFRYKIGWNLDSRGVTCHWDRDYTEIKGVGWYGGGAEVEVAQLDDNPRPEMILMAYDALHDHMNWFRYRVGWNLDTNGKAVSWSNYIEGLGVGYVGNGAGMTLTQMDSNPRPELLLVAYDNFPDQPGFFRYRVAWNLNVNGVPDSWSNITELPGVETIVKGVDIGAFNLDADERPEVIIMGYYNLSNPKNNVFGYRVLKNKTAAKRIHLEMDKLSSTKWPPQKVIRGKTSHTLQSIYGAAGIDLDLVRDQGSIAEIKPGKPYTDAEIHCFLTTYMNNNVPADKQGAWPMYGAILTSHVDGIPAMMFTLNQQRGFVIFSNECQDDAQYLRTTAHQIGHALNLKHSDGDAWEGPYSIALKGYTLMNPSWKLADHWNFTWSAASLFHFYHHLANRWQPFAKAALANCH